ncbi:MAG TPA: adenosylcobinamide-GDP ribazoletransferase [Candidatus Limnocylindrales bacterium]|nr:adenosylcobinamide-GDP ribazoletransferase [Candidatus Limnocylindrales bacterium]
MADVAGVGLTRAGPTTELRAAVAFLTRVPVARGRGVDATTGAAAFPVVGALIGAAAALPSVVAGPDHAVMGAILAVAVVAVLDGGLHLDGLADTVDALAAPPDAAERARTDPRLGSAGVVAIVITLALEVAALAELTARGNAILAAALIAAGATSRAVAPALAIALGGRRPGPAGLGSWFAERIGRGRAGIAVGLALGFVVLAGAAAGSSRVVGATAVGLLAATAIVWAVVARRGQLDGDGHGFAIEATFAVVLVATAVLA